MKKFCTFILASLLLSGCLRKELQTGLEESEAQEIIVLLQESGIQAERELVAGKQDQPSWAVYIKGGEQDRLAAWRILQENGLPREKSKGLDEIFSKSGLIPTPSEEKARLILGLSGEMSRTLESVAGVVDARVHVVLPENSPLLERSEWSPTTASVLVKYQGQQPPFREQEIRNLVARGIEGLRTENVAVVFKKVEVKQLSQSGPGWHLTSQRFVICSAVLLMFSTIGSAFLVVRSRQQRTKIQGLQKMLYAASTKPQLVEAGSEKQST